MNEKPEPSAASPFIVDSDTLFLLGNGPSLASVDLHALSPHATLGMNAAYRYWREIDWRPSYYACLDLVVGRSHADEIAALIAEGRIRQFILREDLIDHLGAVGADDRVVNFDSLRFVSTMLRCDPVTTGSHAALWAAYEGYRKIVIMGVDGKYVETVKGAASAGGIELEIVEEAENPNYFFAGYQQKGDKFNIPNPRPGLHVSAWGAVAREFALVGVAAVNANPNSEVRYFPFVDAGEIVGKGVSRLEWTGVEAAPEAAADGSRMQEFLRRQRSLLLVGVLLSALCAATGFGFAPSPFGKAASLAGAVLLALFVAALAYVRFTASDHIDQLAVRLARAEAALIDLQRRKRRSEKSPK